MIQTLRIALLSLAAIGLLPSGPSAGQAASAPPTVIELFTSQSCYSCPPAERLLGELAQRADIIALEHHVDYWDDLIYGLAGKWKDVFSSPESTRRQRRYNESIQGRGYAYTPQMVFDGRIEAVGNRPRNVTRAIEQARADTRGRLSVAVSRLAEGGLRIVVDGAVDEHAGIWLLRYKNEHTTRPTGGENKGKSLTNYNIVRAVRRVGDWSGAKVTVELADFALEDGFGCAVLVQSARPGPIIGAARCPSLSS